MSTETENGPGRKRSPRGPDKRTRKRRTGWFDAYIPRALELYEQKVPVTRIGQILHDQGVRARKTLSDKNLQQNPSRITQAARDALMLNGHYSKRMTVTNIITELKRRANQGDANAAIAVTAIEAIREELHHG